MKNYENLKLETAYLLNKLFHTRKSEHDRKGRGVGVEEWYIAFMCLLSVCWHSLRFVKCNGTHVIKNEFVTYSN